MTLGKHSHVAGSCKQVIEDIGNAHLEEAQALIFDHVRAQLGPEMVQRICSSLMLYYCGVRQCDSSSSSKQNRRQDPLANMLSALQPTTPRIISCYASADCGQSGHSWRDVIWYCTDSYSSFEAGPSLSELGGMTFHDLMLTLIQYAAMYTHEMRLRGLMLKVTRPVKSSKQMISGFSLTPESAIWIRRFD